MNRRDFLARASAAPLAGILPLPIARAEAATIPLPTFRDCVMTFGVRVRGDREWLGATRDLALSCLGLVNDSALRWPLFGGAIGPGPGTVMLLGASDRVWTDGACEVDYILGLKPAGWNRFIDPRTGRREIVTAPDGGPLYPACDLNRLGWDGAELLWARPEREGA